MSMPFRSESSLFFVKGIPDLSFSSRGAARWKHSVYFFPLNSVNNLQFDGQNITCSELSSSSQFSKFALLVCHRRGFFTINGLTHVIRDYS